MTPRESEFNLRCYGCHPDEVLGALAGPIEEDGLGSVLMSLLSDVQEMIAHGALEDARKALNRAKLVIHQKLPTPR